MRERSNGKRRDRMSEVPWMLVRLGHETSAHHGPADDDRLAALDVKSLAAYRDFLVRIYGFEAEVEHVLAHTRQLDTGVLRERMRAARLRQDLLALGLSEANIADIALATNVNVRSAGQALGWLFVIERQTLLSGLVRRHAQRVLGDQVRGALSYLSAYGDTPGARFRALGEALGKYAHRYPPSVIVWSANDAFRAQRHWYRSSATTPLARRERGTAVREVQWDDTRSRRAGTG